MYFFIYSPFVPAGSEPAPMSPGSPRLGADERTLRATLVTTHPSTRTPLGSTSPHEGRASSGGRSPLRTEAVFKDGSVLMYDQHFPEEGQELNVRLTAK